MPPTPTCASTSSPTTTPSSPARLPSDPARAFVALGAVDLDLIPFHEEERTVALDNVVVPVGVFLQLDKQPGRRTCARLRVIVRRHLDGAQSAWRGTLRSDWPPRRGVLTTSADNGARGQPPQTAPTPCPIPRYSP